MDPLGIAASTISLIELLSNTYEFLRAIKDGLTERKELLFEISWLHGMLHTLRNFIDIEKDNIEWLTSLAELYKADGPMQQLQYVLEQLRLKVHPSKTLASATRTVFWKNERERVKDSLAKIERLKSLIQMALNLDHIQLSSAMKKRSDHHEFVALLKWLSSAVYQSRLRENVELRLKGTAQWFLDEAWYLDWISGGTHTLFCPGDPGTGKSVIAATAVHELRRILDTRTNPVIYLSCDYHNQKTQNLDRFLGDVLRQLVNAKGVAPPYMYDMQRKHESAGSCPPTNELREWIQGLLSDCEQSFVVVDALDECDGQVREALVSFFRELQRSRPVRLLATSRPISTVQRLFDNDREIAIRASEHDVRIYARARLAEFRVQEFPDSTTVDTIVDAVVVSANGVFLLAQLHLDSLAEKPSPRAVMAALANLPSGSNEERYTKTYEATMKRIETQSPGDIWLAKFVLRWIIVTKRPLRLAELQHALAIRWHDTEFDPNGLVDENTLLSVCAGLVVVVYETSGLSAYHNSAQAERLSAPFVRLVHFSADDHFRRTMRLWFPRGDFNIAKTCLTYLSLGDFKCRATDNDAEIQGLLQRYPLLEYAAQHWGEHAKDAENSANKDDFNELISALERFLQQPELIDKVEQIRQTTSDWVRSGIVIQGRDAFHEMARFDLSKTCEHFLKKRKHYEDRRDSNNQTALHVAAIYGSAEVLRMLVRAGMTDVNARDAHKDWSPLLYAVSNRHQNCVELLLGPGKADVNASSSSGREALFKVAEAGDQTIAEILLRHLRLNVDHKNNDGNTTMAVTLPSDQNGMAELLQSSCKLTT